MPQLASPRNPQTRQAGHAALQVAAGLAIIASLVLITVPVSERRRHEIERKICIENLAWIAAAKEEIALHKGMKPGQTVTIEELKADSKVLPSSLVFPPGASWKINPIGEAPSCMFLGERLTPLVDFKKIRLYETA